MSFTALGMVALGGRLVLNLLVGIAYLEKMILYIIMIFLISLTLLPALRERGRYLFNYVSVYYD